MNPPSVFISYGHVDAGAVDWLAKVRSYLAVFENQKRLTVFDDRAIPPGAQWYDMIRRELLKADAAILLVGPHFLGSVFVATEELPVLLEAVTARGTLLFPVVVMFCAYHETPLKAYQACNPPSRPLEAMSDAEQNQVLNELSLRLVKELERKAPGDRESPGPRVEDALNSQPPSAPRQSRPVAAARPRVAGQRLLDVTTSFKNRVEQQAAIKRLLASPSTHIVTIVGPPGIGKTALASKVLMDLERRASSEDGDSFEVDGIVYLSTRTSRIDLSEMLVQCARMFGGERQALLDGARTSDVPIPEKIASLVESFTGGTYVILLDHFEDALDDRGRVADPHLMAALAAFLSTPDSARLLVTSCVPLALDSQWRRFNLQLRLEDGLTTADGVALLRELDPNNDSGLRDARAEVLAPAVERLHGVPRALEILAGILEDAGPRSNLKLTLDRFYTLENVGNELFRQSHARLDPAARLVLQALSVFRRPMAVAALVFLVEPFAPGVDVSEIVQRLVRAQMMRTIKAPASGSDEDAKLALHAMDEDYAYAQIPEDGGAVNRIALERRAADYYRSILPSRGHWRDAAAAEPLVLEFEHRVKAGDIDRAARILTEVDSERLMIGALSSLQMREALDGRLTDPALLMAHIYGKATAQVCLGMIDEGMDGFNRALDLARARGDAAAAVEYLGSLGEAARRLGRLDDALVWTSEAVQAGRDLGDPVIHARWLNELSLLSTYRGDLTAAVDHAQHALALATEAGDIGQQALATDALSLSSLRSGRPELALEYGERAMTLYQNTSWKHTTNYVLNVLGLACFATGRVDEAIARLSQGLLQSTQDNDSRPQALAQFNLARAFRVKGDLAGALAHARSAQQIFERMKAGELAAARALVDTIEAQQAGLHAAQARGLLQCARASLAVPDLCHPHDLVVEAQAIADQEQLADVARDLAALFGTAS